MTLICSVFLNFTGPEKYYPVALLLGIVLFSFMSEATGGSVKSLVLRYGGLRLYRQWLPFFLGLIMGDYLAGGLWAILGAILDIKIYRIFVI